MKLQNKVAVITGGARGIGKALAFLFAREGARIVLISRTGAEVRETEDALKKITPHVLGIVGDISRWKDAEKLIQKTVKKFDTVDILVNCAGIQAPIGAFSDVAIAAWVENINVNLMGTVFCCKAVLPVMLRHKKGKIINFSGGGAVAPRPHFTAYASSKAAVVRFTETLAVEVKKNGICVNAIAPGAVATAMTRQIIASGNKAGEKELREAVAIRQKRVSADMAAALALFLASDDSDGLTGRLISAPWDGWKHFSKDIETITDSSLYTMRRIDGRNFIERTR